MSLPHAILTALIERPGSGSELADRFHRSIGHFWHATHQQIYRELARLEAAGLVASHPVPQGRGRKRAYEILPEGRRELGQWVREPAEPKLMRDDLMVRLRAEAVVGPTGLDAEIARHLGLHEAKLQLYRDIEARDFGRGPLDRAARLRRLVLRAGIASEEAWIAFCREALDILAAPPADADAAPRL